MGAALSASKKAYRYFPLHRALQVIQAAEFPMLLPTSWWDPLESAWSEQSYQTKRRLAKKTVFGSCWTTGARNDALWQIYSKSAPAVRMRTTIGALEDLMTNSDCLSDGKLYFGKVIYCQERKLANTARELAAETFNKDVGRHLIKGLMHKRLAFQFEDELRILWIKAGKDSRSVLNVPINPRKLFDQIRIDPRLDSSLAADLCAAIKTLSGIEDVKQSSLASLPMGA